MTKEWWHDLVGYQIYPKSFQDSNADGIGDLPGILQRLDHLQELGVSLIWLSPCFKSPLADQGYDISDYRDIDPRFGTMEDLDRLILEAGKRGIRIILDLVVNHCSDEHPWFKKACEDPEGPYAEYFYIRKLAPGDPLPCNWRSYFGGPVWDRLPGHEEYVYLHVFHKKQPDLNWENPRLREEVYEMMNFWLDRGIAGFRIDAIINIKKVLPFRDYPPDRPDGLCSMGTMLSNATGVLSFLHEMSERTFSPHNAFAIEELFDNRPEDLPEFIGPDGCFSSIFDFAPTMINRSAKGWYDTAPVDPDQYRDACFASQALAEGVGFMSNIIENHDEPRGVSHYIPEGTCTDTAKKMLGGLCFLLRGIPFFYQGQEIGMENSTFKGIEEIDDCSSRAEYEAALSAGMSPEDALRAVAHFTRDNARTPFQWTSGRNAGFTEGTPWLPLNANYPRINLQSQEKDPDSVYQFYRRIIALRKNPLWKETLVYGETRPVLTDLHHVMAYLRKGEKTLLVIGNFSPEARNLTLPVTPRKLLLCNLPGKTWTGRSLEMEGYQFMVFLVDD